MRKIEFHPLLQIKEKEVLDNISKFKELYAEYNTWRKELFYLAENESKWIELEISKNPFTLQEEMSHIIMGIYNRSSSLEEFEDELSQFLSQALNISPDDLKNNILGAYLSPIYLQEQRHPSALEAVYSTFENLKIISEFIEISDSDATSMLLSGTNAWAPFYGVKGFPSKELLELEKEEKDSFEASDIDLLITYQNEGMLDGLIANYLRNGICDEREMTRLEAFHGLVPDDRVAIFSMRSHYKYVEQSIHFVADDQLSNMCHHNERFSQKGIGYLRDFRPNIPRNVMLHGGYPIYELKTGEKRIFEVKTELVASGKDAIGYISETPTGGTAFLAGNKNEKTFYLGLFGFYLLVTPTILLDKNNFLTENINDLKADIKQILAGILPKYIIRQERMPPGLLRDLKTHLTQ